MMRLFKFTPTKHRIQRNFLINLRELVDLFADLLALVGVAGWDGRVRIVTLVNLIQGTIHRGEILRTSL